jgi:hypothetical protein
MIDGIEPIPGYDRVEHAIVGGWRVIVQKDQFEVGDLAIYFEIDSRVPSDNPAFAFLEKRNYKIKTQKMCKSISQGLLMHASDFGWDAQRFSEDDACIIDNKGDRHYSKDESRFLTSLLGVTYADDEDNARKAPSVDNNKKYQSMAARNQKLFKTPIFHWLMRRDWGRKILFFFFGKKKDTPKGFPTKFPYVKKTDQERCENMPFILKDKTPYIRTQKCDGSSGTFILERVKKNKFEFYVCSRNVRMLRPDQECFYGDNNYYWEVAIKYDIENKLKDYLNKHPDLTYVCWQGEICAPGIQKNPHNLKETHFYLFHMIDSKKGRYDMRDVKRIGLIYKMEVVPVDDDLYVMPDDFEEFKKSADGYYSPSVCEGNSTMKREGYVYYKTTDPNFSFKNVSREYLLKH